MIKVTTMATLLLLAVLAVLGCAEMVATTVERRLMPASDGGRDDEADLGVDVVVTVEVFDQVDEPCTDPDDVAVTDDVVVLGVRCGPAVRRRIRTGYGKRDDQRAMRSADRAPLEPREVRVNVPVTVAERARWRVMAKADGLTVAEFVRHVMNEYNPPLPGLPADG